VTVGKITPEVGRAACIGLIKGCLVIAVHKGAVSHLADALFGLDTWEAQASNQFNLFLLIT
jgi:hypothetical protein